MTTFAGTGLDLRSWFMVTPIEAVRNGMGFDEAGRWHQPKVVSMPAPRREDDPLATARGVICGLLISGALWLLLFIGVRMLRSWF
jgi:hypothetical protein